MTQFLLACTRSRRAAALFFGMLLTLCGAVAQAATLPDYQIGAGDTLKISVFENPELATEARVSQTGQIRFPLVDLVPVAGLTVDQVEDLVGQRLKDGNFVLHPHVTVVITGYRSQQVSVLGYVAKPGQYSLEKVTRLSDLLAQVGGTLPTAADELVVQRTVGDKKGRVVIDLNRTFMDGDAERDILIQGGDVIYVPKASQIFVEGEVVHPGPARLEHGMTVSQAISAAGGVGPRGSERAIKVKRRNAKGVFEVRNAAADDLVQADDVLIAEPWQFYIYGEVQKPGPYRIDPNLTFQQALVLGGGVTPRGNIKGLRVTRRLDNGTTQIMEDVSLIDLVRPDDVIFVKERLF